MTHPALEVKYVTDNRKGADGMEYKLKEGEYYVFGDQFGALVAPRAIYGPLVYLLNEDDEHWWITDQHFDIHWCSDIAEVMLKVMDSYIFKLTRMKI